MENSVSLKKYILIYIIAYLILSFISFVISAIYSYDIGYFYFISNFLSINLSTLAFIYDNYRIPDKLEVKKLTMSILLFTIIIDIVFLVIQILYFDISFRDFKPLSNSLEYLIVAIVILVISFFILVLPAYLIIFLTYKYITTIQLNFFNKYIWKGKNILFDKPLVESESVDNKFSINKYMVLFGVIYLCLMFLDIILVEYGVIRKSMQNTTSAFVSAMIVAYKFVYDNNRAPFEAEQYKLIWFSLLMTFLVDIIRFVAVLSLSNKTNVLFKLKNYSLTIMPIPLILFMYFAQLIMFYFAYGYIARKQISSINKKIDKKD